MLKRNPTIAQKEMVIYLGVDSQIRILCLNGEQKMNPATRKRVGACSTLAYVVEEATPQCDGYHWL